MNVSNSNNSVLHLMHSTVNFQNKIVLHLSLILVISISNDIIRCQTDRHDVFTTYMRTKFTAKFSVPTMTPLSLLSCC